MHHVSHYEGRGRAGPYVRNGLDPFVHVGFVNVNSVREVVWLFNGIEEGVIEVFLEHKLHLVWR